MKPRLLDLFCGAGGCSVGYARAGFEVVGVDAKPQPHYPFEFHHADAMTFDLDGFDAIHASPPCQAYSITRHTHSNEHPDLLIPVLDRLKAHGVPWVIENVPGAVFDHSLVLCGTQFGLKATDMDGRVLHLKRHRLFASDRMLMAPGLCTCADHLGEIGGVYGGGTSDRARARCVRRGGYTPATQVRRELMGIDWMTGNELSQAIPPAYTEWIGAQLLEALKVGVA